jgi:hypothetical protein
MSDHKEPTTPRLTLDKGDCRLCINFRQPALCFSTLQCVEGSRFSPGTPIQLWAERPAPRTY